VGQTLREHVIDRRRRALLVWICAAVIAGAAPRASADPASIQTAPRDDDARPWASGVSDEEQELARSLHAEGNTEFAELRFAQALAKYREALRHWDHPAIRFNIAVSLINLDQLVEAKDNLERSLMYRAAALGSDAYTQAMTYRKLLDAQLAHLHVACSEPGAVVTLDGKYLFTAPGTIDQFLLPGDHQLAATKAGLRTVVVTATGVAGKLSVFDLRPAPELSPPHWRYWKHVLGGGSVLVAIGAVTLLSASRGFDSYDQQVMERCKDRPGCPAEKVRDLNAELAGAETKQTVAFSLIGVGGTAILVAVVGLIVDQPRIRPDAGRAAPVVTVTPGRATFGLSWAY
jgi:hypothetical protein